jgi:hypothetical protein
MGMGILGKRIDWIGRFRILGSSDFSGICGKYGGNIKIDIG